MQHELAIMGRNGDTKVLWETEADAAVHEAERLFAENLARGAAAYTIDPVTKASTRVTAFDPTATRTILIPQMQGG